MATFVLEIGTEELPARFLPNEQAELEKKFTDALRSHFLEYDKLAAFTTPRRAVVIIEGIKAFQTETTTVIQGPAKKIAYTPSGEPTRALSGFLAANNAQLADIFDISNEKGEYVALRITIGGKDAATVLAEICPQIIGSLSFPKSMRWGSYNFVYARPVRWVLALLDTDVVPFEAGHLKSGRETYGHRVHGPGPFEVSDASQYRKAASDSCQVVIDPEERKKLIISLGNQEAEKRHGKVIWKESLLDEVQGLVEMPVPLLGEFETKFLELPREVLLTSMETHQKSFGVEDANGKLLPYFLTVLNIRPTDISAVKLGWEKVLKARLEDARFFWNEDLKTGFDVWLEKLKKVIFIGSLGNMWDRKLRLEELCAWLADELRLPGEDKNNVVKAAYLAKADLVSGMVGEFDTLQGIMGGIYAEKFGYNKAIAEAIKEQYLPLGPDSPLPQSLVGALLAIADKSDTISGCFGLNMIPTGAADPNGLRRCALGIIRILIAFDLNISLHKLFEKAYQFYGEQKWKLNEQERLEKIISFFKGRLRNYFQHQGFDTVLIDAVLEAGLDNIPDCARRLESLALLRKTDSWLPIMHSMKRIDNITHKYRDSIPNAWDETLLTEAAEKYFTRELEKNLPDLDEQLNNRDYSAAFGTLANFIPLLDQFFEKIMVMDENKAIMLNRMSLLNAFGSRFAKIAQVSSLQI